MPVTASEEPTPAASSSSPNYGSVPVPDPTKLTADAVNQAKADLRRELGAQRELIEARVAALEGIAGTMGIQMSSMPNAAAHEAVKEQIKVFADAANAGRDDLSAEIREHIANLQALHEERFSAIAQQFTERDIRTEQDKKSSKEALDAALLAQKESVRQQNDANTTAATKSEVSFTKQTDQLVILISTLEKSLTDRITELKERIDRGEGSNQGAQQQVTTSRLNTGQIIAFVSMAAVSVGVIASILIAVFHR